MKLLKPPQEAANRWTEMPPLPPGARWSRSVRNWYSRGVNAEVPPDVCNLAVCVLCAANQFAGAQDPEQTASLVHRFRETHDVADKERILNLIVQRGYGIRSATPSAGEDDGR